MRIDRGLFFAAFRKAFGPLDQLQVDTIESVLTLWEARYVLSTPLAQLAYCLGTAWHEARLKPIKEHGDRSYFMRMYDPSGSRPHVAKTLGNCHVGDGATFCGRGLVQLTGRANYRKATGKLRELGLLTKAQDLEATPELVLQPSLAAPVLLEGMERAWFTGRDLDDYIDGAVDGDEYADFVNARRIINGKDRAGSIAGYSEKFLQILQASAREGDATKPPIVATKPATIPPKPATKPADPATPAPPAPPAPAPQGGFFHTMAERLRTAFPLKKD